MCSRDQIRWYEGTAGRERVRCTRRDWYECVSTTDPRSSTVQYSAVQYRTVPPSAHCSLHHTTSTHLTVVTREAGQRTSSFTLLVVILAAYALPQRETMTQNGRHVPAAAGHHFLVRLLDGHTACIALPSASLYDLHAYIERCYGIPASLQRLVSDGRVLQAGAVDSPFTPVTLLLSLPGGKGGFGSLLRATTARVGVKRTSDFSAMRDLHGRRMRHVEQDRQLQRWEDEMAGKSEEEKRRMRSEQRSKMARIKRGQRVEDRKVCRWGAQCKYKYKCRGSHPDEEEAKQTESGQMGGVGVASWQAALVDEEDIMEDLQAGMRRSTHSEEKEQQSGEEEDEEQYDDAGSEVHQSDDKREEGSSHSRRRMWDEDLLLDDEDDGDDQKEEEAVSRRGQGPATEEKQEKGQWPKRKRGGWTAARDEEKQPQNEQQDGQRRDNSDRPSIEEKEERKEQWTDAQQVRHGQSGCSSIVVLTQPTSATAPASHSLTSTSLSVYPAIDLSQQATAASLHVYGMEHLRAELDRVGLKTGGTIAERAERLFMLKNHRLQQLPKKMLKR